MMTAKPCPFCPGPGPDPIVVGDADLFWVECMNPLCGAEGPMRDTEDLAIEAWNLAIRAPTDPNAACNHTAWCPICNPALVARR